MRVRFRTVLGICVGLLGGAPAYSQEPARTEAGRGGFALGSADQEWRLRLRGLVQVDGRRFADDGAPNDDNEWLLRRVRPSFEGEFGERVAFRLMPDFGGGTSQIIDAWIDTKIGDALTLRAGKFKPPIGLERLQSANDLRLVERSVATELVPQRDIGVQLSGGGDRVTWAAGVFNGVIDGRSADRDEDGKQELAARIFVEPLASGPDGGLLGVGMAASYGSMAGAPGTPLLPGYRSPGQNVVFAYRVGLDGTFAEGNRTRVSPQFYWYLGPVGVLGEWVRVSQDVRRVGASLDRSATLDHEAWQITGEWFLTGEAAGYRDPEGIGAIQLVARLSKLVIDEAAFLGGLESFANSAAAVSNARTVAIGVNWFPIAGLKASFVYQHTSFDGGAPGGDRADENVLFVRLQHRF